MKTHSDGQIQCRVRIEGSYKGETFIYEDPEGSDGSQFIWPATKKTDDERASRYWWEDGNMGCDCNRSKFLPPPISLMQGNVAMK